MFELAALTHPAGTIPHISETGFLQFLGSDGYQDDAGFRISHEATFQYDAHGDIDE